MNISMIKKNVGFLYGVFFYIMFFLLAEMLRPFFDGAGWYIVNAGQRLLFGMIELAVFVKIFQKDKWTDVIHFRHCKSALFAGCGMLLLTLVQMLYLIIGVSSFMDTTVLTVVSCLLFQQITTGFWEELNYRAFIVEGYFTHGEKTVKRRLCYAALSFALFGFIHAVECDDILFALYRFVSTGIMGFVFASIYLYSHNILIPMLLHFFYDVFANAGDFVECWKETEALMLIGNYVYWIVMGVMFVGAVYFVVKDGKSPI